MNKLVVAFLAGIFAFGPASAWGEDEKQQAAEKLEPNKSAETPKDKALKASKPQPLPTTNRGAVGDFPPFGGRTVDQWRQDEKRRKERLQETTPTSTTPKSTAPKSTEEERAERKRLVDEWEMTQRPAAK